MRTLPIVALLAACAHAGPRAPTAAAHHHRVVVISVDGMLPATYLDPDAHGLRVPALRALRDRGAWSTGMRPVYPAITYPNHTTMITGVMPAKHGIHANLTWDPLERTGEAYRYYVEDIKAPTLWDAVEAHGLHAAILDWPATLGARVSVDLPSIPRTYTDEDRKLLRVVTRPDGLLDAVAAQAPGFWGRLVPDLTDSAVADVAIYLLRTAPPDLLLVHLGETDDAQHHDGVWSPQAIDTLEGADRQIGRIVDELDRDGLADDTLLIVLSDHGFMPVTTKLRPGVWLAEAGLVTLGKDGHPTAWKASVVGSGGQAYVYLADPDDHATADAVRALFAARVADGKSGLRAMKDEAEIRAVGGDPKAFLSLEAQDGFVFARGYAGDVTYPSPSIGHHGYDPARPEMQASLIVVAKGVAHAEIPGARVLDIAPTIAAWLGVPMPNVDGKPLALPR